MTHMNQKGYSKTVFIIMGAIILVVIGGYFMVANRIPQTAEEFFNEALERKGEIYEQISKQTGWQIFENKQIGFETAKTERARSIKRKIC